MIQITKIYFGSLYGGQVSGVYYYRFTTGNFTQVKKMLLIK
jgi:hypothetical protein